MSTIDVLNTGSQWSTAPEVQNSIPKQLCRNKTVGNFRENIKSVSNSSDKKLSRAATFHTIQRISDCRPNSETTATVNVPLKAQVSVMGTLTLVSGSGDDEKILNLHVPAKHVGNPLVKYLLVEKDGRTTFARTLDRKERMTLIADSAIDDSTGKKSISADGIKYDGKNISWDNIIAWQEPETEYSSFDKPNNVVKLKLFIREKDQDQGIILNENNALLCGKASLETHFPTLLDTSKLFQENKASEYVKSLVHEFGSAVPARVIDIGIDADAKESFGKDKFYHLQNNINLMFRNSNGKNWEALQQSKRHADSQALTRSMAKKHYAKGIDALCADWSAKSMEGWTDKDKLRCAVIENLVKEGNLKFISKADAEKYLPTIYHGKKFNQYINTVYAADSGYRTALSNIVKDNNFCGIQDVKTVSSRADNIRGAISSLEKLGDLTPKQIKRELKQKEKEQSDYQVNHIIPDRDAKSAEYGQEIGELKRQLALLKNKAYRKEITSLKMELKKIIEAEPGSKAEPGSVESMVAEFLKNKHVENAFSQKGINALRELRDDKISGLHNLKDKHKREISRHEIAWLDNHIETLTVKEAAKASSVVKSYYNQLSLKDKVLFLQQESTHAWDKYASYSSKEHTSGNRELARKYHHLAITRESQLKYLLSSIEKMVDIKGADFTFSSHALEEIRSLNDEKLKSVNGTDHQNKEQCRATEKQAKRINEFLKWASGLPRHEKTNSAVGQPSQPESSEHIVDTQATEAAVSQSSESVEDKLTIGLNFARRVTVSTDSTLPEGPKEYKFRSFYYDPQSQDEKDKVDKDYKYRIGEFMRDTVEHMSADVKAEVELEFFLQFVSSLYKKRIEFITVPKGSSKKDRKKLIDDIKAGKRFSYGTLTPKELANWIFILDYGDGSFQLATEGSKREDIFEAVYRGLHIEDNGKSMLPSLRQRSSEYHALYQSQHSVINSAKSDLPLGQCLVEDWDYHTLVTMAPKLNKSDEMIQELKEIQRKFGFSILKRPAVMELLFGEKYEYPVDNSASEVPQTGKIPDSEASQPEASEHIVDTQATEAAVNQSSEQVAKEQFIDVSSSEEKLVNEVAVSQDKPIVGGNETLASNVSTDSTVPVGGSSPAFTITSYNNKYKLKDINALEEKARKTSDRAEKKRLLEEIKEQKSILRKMNVSFENIEFTENGMVVTELQMQKHLLVQIKYFYDSKGKCNELATEYKPISGKGDLKIPGVNGKIYTIPGCIYKKYDRELIASHFYESFKQVEEAKITHSSHKGFIEYIDSLINENRFDYMRSMTPSELNDLRKQIKDISRQDVIDRDSRKIESYFKPQTAENENNPGKGNIIRINSGNRIPIINSETKGLDPRLMTIVNNFPDIFEKYEKNGNKFLGEFISEFSEFCKNNENKARKILAENYLELKDEDGIFLRFMKELLFVASEIDSGLPYLLKDESTIQIKSLFSSDVEGGRSKGLTNLKFKNGVDLPLNELFVKKRYSGGDGVIVDVENKFNYPVFNKLTKNFKKEELFMWQEEIKTEVANSRVLLDVVAPTGRIVQEVIKNNDITDVNIKRKHYKYDFSILKEMGINKTQFVEIINDFNLKNMGCLNVYQDEKYNCDNSDGNSYFDFKMREGSSHLNEKFNQLFGEKYSDSSLGSVSASGDNEISDDLSDVARPGDSLDALVQDDNASLPKTGTDNPTTVFSVEPVLSPVSENISQVLPLQTQTPSQSLQENNVIGKTMSGREIRRLQKSFRLPVSNSNETSIQKNEQLVENSQNTGNIKRQEPSSDDKYKLRAFIRNTVQNSSMDVKAEFEISALIEFVNSVYKKEINIIEVPESYSEEEREKMFDDIIKVSNKGHKKISILDYGDGSFRLAAKHSRKESIFEAVSRALPKEKNTPPLELRSYGHSAMERLHDTNFHDDMPLDNLLNHNYDLNTVLNMRTPTLTNGGRNDKKIQEIKK